MRLIEGGIERECLFHFVTNMRNCLHRIGTVRILWFVLILLGPFAARGQSHSVSSTFYSLNEGLSDRSVKTILQGRDGMVWIGTSDGLNRFDGLKFMGFSDSPSAPSSSRLSANDIQSLSADKAGNLIVIFNNNPACFDIFNPWTHENTQVELHKKGVKGFARNIYVSRSGEIFVLSVADDHTNLYKFTEKRDFKLLFSIEERHQSKSPFIDLLQTSDGSFFINDSEKGLRLLDTSGTVLQHFLNHNFDSLQNPGQYPGRAYFLHQDRLGRIWYSLANNPGVFYFNPQSMQFEMFKSLPQNKLYSSLWEDDSGNILFAQTDGIGNFPGIDNLFCYSASGMLYDFNYIKDLGDFIATIYGKNFFKTIFLGIDTGLKIVQNNHSKVKKFLAENLTVDRRGPVIRGIDGDQRGTVYFSRERRKWYALDLKTDILDTLDLVNPHTGEFVSFNCQLDIHLDAQNFLWGVACDDSGKGLLLRYDPENCNLNIYSYPYTFNAFTIDRKNMIWLVASPVLEKGQLVSFNPESREFNTFLTREGNNPLKGATPRFVMESRDGLIWVGTENGLYKIDRQNATADIFDAKPDAQSPALSSNTVLVLHEDDLGRIWAGTNSGINILDPIAKTISVYDQSSGLAGNKVCGILPDENGNYWISTYNGLSYFNPKLETFHNFYQSDGLSHDEFNRFSYHRDENGRYYFGGVNGMNAFFPEDLLVNEKVPPVVLTGFTRFNSRSDRHIEQKSRLNELKKIVISPYDTYFVFFFTLPDYASPHRNQFSSWLEGLEKDWTYLGNTPTIRYNKLPPGRYTLHLKGADPNGNWSEQVLAIDIFVKRIFYTTGWFIGLLILALAIFVRFIFQSILDQKLKVERLRTKLSSDIHDEVSGLLSGIAMQSDILQTLTQDATVQNRLRSIGEASRKAMSKMSDVIWSIDSRKDRMEDLIQRMREHADDILLPLSIRYELEVQRIEIHQKIPTHIRQELYLIFKEVVNNIAKHSKASTAKIRLESFGPTFEMAIRDNGGARTKNGAKSGQGISNIRMRAQRINASLKIENENGYSVILKMKKFT
jgi:ligand-binding sensor domain-containing protein/two-component sensor histidine kinase